MDQGHSGVLNARDMRWNGAKPMVRLPQGDSRPLETGVPAARECACWSWSMRLLLRAMR